MMVADGEGATKIMRLRVQGAENAMGAERVARAIADSPLVKTAMHGGDPNWGRIISSAGAAMAGRSLPERQLMLVRSQGGRERGGVPGLSADREQMTAAVKQPEVDIELDLGLGVARRSCSSPTWATSTSPSTPNTTREDRTMREIYRKRVETLLESLPYIRMFAGKTMVIKYGGAAMSSADLKDEFATDIALLRYVGIKPIIVHGGGDEISSYMKRLDLPVKFVEGLRVTDAATMEVAKMVLVGKVNKEIVGLINSKGAPAVGLCGDDGWLLRGRAAGEARPGRLASSISARWARSPRSTSSC